MQFQYHGLAIIIICENKSDLVAYPHWSKRARAYALAAGKGLHEDFDSSCCTVYTDFCTLNRHFRNEEILETVTLS